MRPVVTDQTQNELLDAVGSLGHGFALVREATGTLRRVYVDRIRAA